jgi:hypothetical protein
MGLIRKTAISRHSPFKYQRVEHRIKEEEKKLYGLSVLAGFQCAGTNGVFTKLNGSLDLALVPPPRPELQRVGFFVWNGENRCRLLYVAG